MLQEIDIKSQDPSFWTNQDKAKSVLKEKSQIESVLIPFKSLWSSFFDNRELLELARTENDQAMVSDALHALQQCTADLRKLELQTMLNEPTDPNNALVTINAGSGGTESCDWASMLLRMYTRWGERRGYKVNLLDFLDGDAAGIKSASLSIEGPMAYGYLKSEHGVHRLVRISPFDSNARRHTSFCSVSVAPEVDETIDIEIKDADLKVDTYKSGGAGGQHVNKTESAVRITHMPTGVIVACQMERSQHKNRATAMKMLKAKLYQIEMEKRRGNAQAAEDAKLDSSWGSQIRSYVLQPYRLVKDHRTGYHMNQSEPVLDGDLDGFMEAHLLFKTHGVKAGSTDEDTDL